MKKVFTTLLMTLAAGAFAQESAPATLLSANVLPETRTTISIEEKVAQNKGFTYFRMGVTDSYPASTLNDVKIVPSLGLGYRYATGPSAIDVSANFCSRLMPTYEGHKDTYSYTLPKVNYLHYVTPARNNSLYAGGGMAFSGMKTKDENEFLGLVPNIAVGYEMNRNQNWKSFVQLDISQPAIAARSKGNFPGPLAEVSFGAGF